jgi:hypothetical protein
LFCKTFLGARPFKRFDSKGREMWIKEKYLLKEKYPSESSHEGESKGESWF